MKKRSFTLIELMLGIALLMLAAGAVSWNVYQAVKKYKFKSNVSRLQVQLQSCYRLALNTSLDWKFHLSYDKHHLRVQALCLHGSAAPPKALLLDPIKVLFNGQEAEQLSIYFSPTGLIEPEGFLELSFSSYHHEILLSDLFRIKQLPDKEGPMHPDDLSPS
jgi:hypothetical protein